MHMNPFFESVVAVVTTQFCQTIKGNLSCILLELFHVLYREAAPFRSYQDSIPRFPGSDRLGLHDQDPR